MFLHSAYGANTSQPGPAVMQNCLPDPIISLRAGVLIAVLFMMVLATLIWLLAALPETPNRSLSLPGAGVTAGTPLLRRRRPRLDTLEGCRTVLVMYILAYHVRWALPPVLAPWFQHGHCAVTFFFVVAGFVAALSQDATGDEQPISVDAARTMAVRRFTRLCPPYYVALFGVAAMMAFRGGGEPFLVWPIQALFLQSLLPVTVCGPIDVGHWSHNFVPFGANGEGWFVSAILIAGLLFPLLYNARPRGGFRATLAELVLVILLRSIPTFLTIAGWTTMVTYAFAPLRILEFAAGVLSAQLYKEMPAWLAQCGAWDWIFDASLCWAAVSMWLLDRRPSFLASESSHGDYFLTAVFCVTCIAACGVADQQAEPPKRRYGPLSGLLSSWVLVDPALYSYQAYVYQEVFIAAMALLPSPYNVKFMWLTVVLPWLAGILSVHLLEEPLKRAVEARLAAARQTALSK